MPTIRAANGITGIHAKAVQLLCQLATQPPIGSTLAINGSPTSWYPTARQLAASTVGRPRHRPGIRDAATNLIASSDPCSDDTSGFTEDREYGQWRTLQPRGNGPAWLTQRRRRQYAMFIGMVHGHHGTGHQEQMSSSSTVPQSAVRRIHRRGGPTYMTAEQYDCSRGLSRETTSTRSLADLPWAQSPGVFSAAEQSPSRHDAAFHRLRRYAGPGRRQPAGGLACGRHPRQRRQRHQQ